MAPGGLASIKRGRAYPGRFPALGGGMLAAQGGYVFGDAHSPPGRPVPLAAPRWDQVPPVLCCAWVDGDRCAGVSGVICTVQAGSPHLPNAAGVCLRGRLTGQHAWCCVALRWRNLKVRSPALVPGSPEQQSLAERREQLLMLSWPTRCPLRSGSLVSLGLSSRHATGKRAWLAWSHHPRGCIDLGEAQPCDLLGRR